MDWQVDGALLVVRLIVGVVMVFHGTQKLFGWWGGEGLHGAAEFFGRLGYRPPMVMAIIAACIETTGGVLLAVGFLTPVAAVLLLSTLVNVLVVHARNGLDRKKNGFEFELVLLAAVACIALTGPGAISLDSVVGVDLAALVLHVVRIDVHGIWGALVILAGAVGGIVVASTRRQSA